MAEAPLPFGYPRHRFRPSDSFHRYRLIFQKTEDLIFLSHIDLIRSLERLFRRADLPVRLAGKFHPMPRLIVALALPLGVHGLREVLDVELTEPFPPKEILSALRSKSPVGLHFLDCMTVSGKASSRVVRLGYRFAVPQGRRSGICENIRALSPDGPWQMQRSERRATLMPASGLMSIAEDGLESNNLEEWVGRSIRPGANQAHAPVRFIDLREIIESIELLDGSLEAVLRFGEGGTAKPEEVLRLVEAEDLMTQGERIERFMLEMAEISGPSESAPMAGVIPAEGEDI